MAKRSKIEELKASRESLERKLNSGAMSVRHGDKSVQHRTSSEIERQIKRLDEQIAAAEGRRRRRRITYLSIDRGY